MPAIRTVISDTSRRTRTLDLSGLQFKAAPSTTPAKKVAEKNDRDCDASVAVEIAEVVDLALKSEKEIYFPISSGQRATFRTKGGKRVTDHQWAVYDMTRRIPCGKVTTYKDLCATLGEGSPRSVGNALRNNPFAPFVPCHRIISSGLTLGGFLGEWGTADEEGSNCQKKLRMLAQEGVHFTKKGMLEDKQAMLWNINSI